MTVSDVVGQIAGQRRALASRLADVDYVVAVTSGKGGVGKTAVTANIAAALAADGLRVGAVDADLSGPSLATMLGARGQRLALTDDGVRPALGAAEVQVVSTALVLGDDGQPLAWRHAGGLAADTHVWRGTLEGNVLRELVADTAWGELDVLLLDLPPGSDRFEAVTRVLGRLDAVVAVTIPSKVSIEVVRRAVRAARAANAPLAGLVINMAGLRCEDRGALTPLWGPVDAAEAMAAEEGLPVFGAVPFAPALAAAGDRGLPLVLTEPDAPAARALRGVADELWAMLRAEREEPA